MPGSAFFDNLLCTTPAPDRLLTVDQASNERIQSYFDGILNDPLFRQEPIFARFFGLAEHVARSLRPGRASASEQDAGPAASGSSLLAADASTIMRRLSRATKGDSKG